MFIVVILLSLWGCVPSVCETKAEEWNNRVYLATYPRSGNHWLRYLIEEVTHVATSSVYCDADHGRSHLGKPFPWGGYCPKNGYEGSCRYPTSEDVVVIKTHFPAVPAQPFDRKPSLKTIRVVRHPVDSLYSFFVFDHPGKSFTRKIPQDILKRRTASWRKFHEFWNSQPNVVTVRYEDLLNDPLSCLKKILEEIGYTVTVEDIERAVAKYPPTGHPLKHMNKYDPEDLNLIVQELNDLMGQFNYYMP